tara:strand:+ start:42 stop:494 length:453 start_codon:yes stop_codon:yes gene_type:complete
MKTYYIYHIAGIKIGCTNQIEKRMADQNFTDWEILEEHTDINLASTREIQLQKEYGLPVDDIPYWQSIQNRLSGCVKGGQRGGNTNRISGHINRIQKASAKVKRKLTDSQVLEIKSKYVPYRYTSRSLAKEYGVSQRTILQLINNVNYKA